MTPKDIEFIVYELPAELVLDRQGPPPRKLSRQIGSVYAPTAKLAQEAAEKFFAPRHVKVQSRASAQLDRRASVR